MLNNNVFVKTKLNLTFVCEFSYLYNTLEKVEYFNILVNMNLEKLYINLD